MYSNTDFCKGYDHREIVDPSKAYNYWNPKKEKNVGNHSLFRDN